MNSFAVLMTSYNTEGRSILDHFSSTSSWLPGLYFLGVFGEGDAVYGVRFETGFYTRWVPLSFTPLLRLKRCHACDQ
jgi:hypothetical protein